ncbi:MAG: hypothetical protein HOM25_17360 [Rhodospirillaceae bacterium]|jgi:hypothetical protein|nr:hypothetical protein [Rhodospirillaceae bacterium]MBT5666177.1 hypothetical protein [Rhodospirillaceae bacterium]MBT5810628.1 hypothetical protein [Rhodospirillaceae bacterium]
MKVLLFDTMETPPRSKAGHMIVYAGVSAAHENKATTYIDCVYDISGLLVEFRKNGDLHAMRFEGALKWAVSYADSMGIGEIYAMFTLGRALDMAEVRRICPEGLVDCRRYREAPEAPPMPDQTNTMPSWTSLRPRLGSKFKRTFTTGANVSVAGDA